MLNMLKKAFWVPYEDGSVYPTVSKARQAIARYCEIEQATVGSILLRMERDGLVRRTQKDGNRRALYVSLTEKGRLVALQVQQIFQQADAQAAACLSEEERQCLQQLLQKVYDAVTEPERKPF